jgi:hypothetical protein
VVVLALAVTLGAGWWGAQAKHQRVCEALRRQNEALLGHAGDPRDAAKKVAELVRNAGC